MNKNYFKTYTLERDLDRHVCKWLKENKYLFLKQPRGFYPGVPDILILLGGGKHCWIELKAEKGALSRVQTAKIKQLENHGDRVTVCRSVSEVITAVEVNRYHVPS